MPAQAQHAPRLPPRTRSALVPWHARSIPDTADGGDGQDNDDGDGADTALWDRTMVQSLAECRVRQRHPDTSLAPSLA